MMRHFSSVKKQVTMDECPQCAGVWLDAGELTQIRNEFATEDERRRAAENLFDDLFGQQMSDERRKSREHLERAKRYAVLSKWLR
jgi:Zn-finger nucleic acid-binding protein